MIRCFLWFCWVSEISFGKKKKKKTFPGWSTKRSKVLPHGKCLGGLGSTVIQLGWQLLFWIALWDYFGGRDCFFHWLLGQKSCPKTVPSYNSTQLDPGPWYRSIRQHPLLDQKMYVCDYNLNETEHENRTVSLFNTNSELLFNRHIIEQKMKVLI